MTNYCLFSHSQCEHQFVNFLSPIYSAQGMFSEFQKAATQRNKHVCIDIRKIQNKWNTYYSITFFLRLVIGTAQTVCTYS